MNRKLYWGLGIFLFLIIGATTYKVISDQKEIAELKKDPVSHQKSKQKKQKNQQLPITQTETPQITLTNIPTETQNAEIPLTATTQKTNTSTETETQDTTPTTGKRMSPHGFGAFPEVSDEYRKTVGIPSWIQTELYGSPPAGRQHELMERVKLKLWEKGHKNVQGSIWKNGKVTPSYSDKVYAKYGTRKTPDGKEVKTLLYWSSSSVPPPSRDYADPYDTGDLAVPDGITIIESDEEDDAIDPYEFLGLSK